MEYRVCVAGESTQYPHKSNISLQTVKKLCSAMDYRICETVESTQYSHKSYIPLQNAKKMAFCDGISCLCGC